MAYKILLMGASYGSLLASKMLFGGHSVHLVCLPAEADLINAEGFRVRMPIRGRKDQIEIDSRKLPGKVSAGGTAGVNPKDYDLVGLAMQEPQYRSPGVRELLDAVAKSRVPCMSIMNMPPLPYVRRIPGLNHDLLKPAYTDPTVWDSFDPETLTLCSPDPQAIRPPEEKVNVLQVTLPTNFKVARLKDEKTTAILRQLEKDIEAVRFDAPEGKIELPVKLGVDSFVRSPGRCCGGIIARAAGLRPPGGWDRLEASARCTLSIVGFGPARDLVLGNHAARGALTVAPGRVYAERRPELGAAGALFGVAFPPPPMPVVVVRRSHRKRPPRLGQ